MLRKKPILIGVGVLAVAAFVVVNLLRDYERPQGVEVEPVARRDLRAVVTASGWLEAHRKVDVSANTMGKVVELAVREGNRVELGDVLLRIDPVRYRGQVEQTSAALRQARAKLEAAIAALDEARDNVEREEALAARGLSAQNALENRRRAATRAEAEVSAARAEIRRQEAALMTAQHDLDQVTVIAEMGGVVTRLNVEEGENVVTGTMNNPGTVLLTISDLGIMDVKLEVDETDVVALELGMRGDVRVDAFPDTTFGAVVTEIGHAPIRRSGRAGESSADFEVVLRMDQVVPGFLPGLSASADIVTAVRDSAVAVPIGALVYRNPEKEARHFERGRAPSDGSDPAVDAGEGTGSQETYGVYVMTEGRAQFRAVTIGITGERYFELLEGLDEGVEIITGPFSVLRGLEAGDRVKRERSAPL